ncbi:dTDP-4-dehydrorhamnose reductase [Sphingobacteriaceae bacterium WQ 2009]|uniref:dTDP-4-dehydrorhamnose reductase n=1 Tax=Rhinopithecimicrobium faecis TaxID=2820698 RepID=A0A8T4H7D0_9SPHI|nr:dTDP-4-dehydrorhamnose reductase [Sphingobacteriaceae bacterium WQ 2009]
MKRRILVTGGSGQVGSEFRELLAELSGLSEYEAYVLTRAELPLDQTLLIADFLKVYEPAIIIHAAAFTAVDLAETEQVEADRINHLATEQIAEYCTINKCKLIYLSTDYVFDGSSNIPLTEEAPTNPINYYGLSKLRGEEAVSYFCPSAIIIRTSWVYSTYGKNFVKTMIRLMAEREEISVVNDQVGSPTYAHDLAQAILTILSRDRWVPGIYHYANGGVISWYEFALAIRDLLGLSCHINGIPSSEYPLPAKRPAYSLLDTTKIKDTYDISIPYWKESLVKMIIELLNPKK